MKIAIFPGSFDPINNGQLDIIEKASKFFDKVIVLVMYNSKKSYLFSPETRLHYVKSVASNFVNVEIDYWGKSLTEYINLSAANVVIRGLMATTNIDDEVYISTLIGSLNDLVEVFFMLPTPKNMYISTKLVQKLCIVKKNLSSVVPKVVEEEIKKEV